MPIHDSTVLTKKLVKNQPSASLGVSDYPIRACPRLLTLNGTTFLAAWDSGTDGARSPRARTISATGELGDLIDSQTNTDDFISGTTNDQNGNAYIAWNRSTHGFRTLYAQHVTVNGAAGNPMQVSTYTDPEENHATLTVDSEGILTVTWESWIEDDDDAPDIYARRFEVHNQNSSTPQGNSSSGGGSPNFGLLIMLAVLIAREKRF